VRRLALLAVAVLVAVLVPATTDAATRATWDTRVFAPVPGGATAAYVFVHPNGHVYAGSYDEKAGDKPSRVFEWSSAGKLLRSWAVPGQDLGVAHGVQVANADARGRLVLLEKSTASVLTLDVTTGRFKKQATLPDLSQVKGKPIPNYASWGPSGALFVTDYGQAVIWRIPAGGGTAKVWFSSKNLEGVGFGTTGIVYRPGSHDFLVAQQTGGPGNPVAGKLYRLGVTSAGKAGALSVLWQSRATELPDGFGVARSGHIYIAGVGLINQLVELSATGKELARFGAAFSGSNGSPIPFDGPSNATFLGTRILVANQSPITGTAEHRAILDVEVGEPGAAIYRPKVSTLS
jgi:sugar lactone lactonase YvrE